MLVETLAQYLATPPEEIKRLLNLSGKEVFHDASYQEYLSHLNVDILYETLPLARDAYAAGLPAFKEKLFTKFNFTTEPVTPFALANWLVGFLEQPNTLSALLEWHTRVPLEIVQAGLPEIITMLDGLPTARAEWQAAVAAIALPLIASPHNYP